MTHSYISLIRPTAERHKLDPLVVEALITKESSGNTWAWNPEPAWRYFWDIKLNQPFRKTTPVERQSQFPPHDFASYSGDRDQEWWGQQASWGLMQIMGAVAREIGYTYPYLTALCDPGTNLDLGCRKLRKELQWASARTESPQEALSSALAAYNGGRWKNAPGGTLRNQSYATAVLAILDTLTQS